MSFRDVVSGEVWRPEPAERYNAVNQLLRQERSGNVMPRRPVSGNTLDFCNVSPTEIPRFTPVSITGVYAEHEQENLWSRYDGQVLVSGVPAVNDLYLWGIAADSVLPGEFGTLTVSGLTPAWFPAGCRRVLPTPSGLAAGDGAEVVAECVEYSSGDRFPGIIRLGGVSGGDGGYCGAFKLQAVSVQEAEIVYGMDPSREYCGRTDVPGLEFIPRGNLTLPEARLYQIYLVFFYQRDENSRYTAEFLTEIPEDAVFYTPIGTFFNGMVKQVLDTGSSETLFFGNTWYLP